MVVTKISEKPNCFKKSFDDGRDWKIGRSKCLDCQFKVECEKGSPKKEHYVSAEEAWRIERSNEKWFAKQDYERYMDSY